MDDSGDDDDFSPHESIFACRANKIMQKQQEAYKEMLKKIEEDDEAEAAGKEENELLVKISEKLKRKPRNKKPKAKPKPPKKAKKAVPAKGSKRKKNSQSENVEENDISNKVVESPINLPAVAKKRLKELELRTSREKNRIDELNRRILSSCASEPAEDMNICIEVEDEQNLDLKIRYLTEISKVNVAENEKFSSIFSKIADQLNCKASEIILYLREESIDLNDTPKSLNLKPWDIIDCIPCKPSEDVQEDEEYKLIIKMQSSDSRKKIDMHVYKLEKFQDIMERYAALRSLPMKDLVFEFDGEKINESDTPEDLDMESGSCVDIKVVGDSKKTEPSTKKIHVVDIEDEIPQSKMLDICVLD